MLSFLSTHNIINTPQRTILILLEQFGTEQYSEWEKQEYFRIFFH